MSEVMDYGLDVNCPICGAHLTDGPGLGILVNGEPDEGKCDVCTNLNTVRRAIKLKAMFNTVFGRKG
jgi:hypothetical protein